MRIPAKKMLACSLSLFWVAAASAAETPPSNPAAATPQAGPAFPTSPSELSFVPILQCRLFNTGAAGAGGMLGANKTRDFIITGSSGFAAQGGAASGCGVPASAVAIAMTLSAVDAKSAGYLSAFPSGAPRPDSAVLTYPKSAAASSNPTIGINNGKISVFSRRNVNVVGDVTGYYVPPMAGLIQSNGATYSGSLRIIDSKRYSTGVYAVTFDRPTRYCSATANSYNVTAFIRSDSFIEPTSNTIRFTAYSPAGTVIDTWFYVKVTC